MTSRWTPAEIILAVGILGVLVMIAGGGFYPAVARLAAVGGALTPIPTETAPVQKKRVVLQGWEKIFSGLPTWEQRILLYPPTPGFLKGG